MVQDHFRFSPKSCSCVLDILKDSDTGIETLFAIRNLCDAHRPVAVPDPDFENKKAAAISQRFQQLEDNRTINLAEIDAYTDLQMSPAEKAGCRAIVERLTTERKSEYDLLLSQPDSNLFFCTNVHDHINEESNRWPKIYTRLKAQFNLTDEQLNTISYSFSGVAPNRTVTVNLGSILSNNQKNNIQAWCNQNIGTGKVVVL